MNHSVGFNTKSTCSGIVAAVCIANNFFALNSRSAVNSLVMDQSIQYIFCLNLSSILLFFYLHADSIPSAWIFCYWSSSHSRGKTGSFPPIEGEKKEDFTLAEDSARYMYEWQSCYDLLKGQGIADVSITAGEEITAKTTAEGVYVLNNVTAGAYTIQVRHW